MRRLFWLSKSSYSKKAKWKGEKPRIDPFDNNSGGYFETGRVHAKRDWKEVNSPHPGRYLDTEQGLDETIRREQMAVESARKISKRKGFKNYMDDVAYLQGRKAGLVEIYTKRYGHWGRHKK